MVLNLTGGPIIRLRELLGNWIIIFGQMVTGLRFGGLPFLKGGFNQGLKGQNPNPGGARIGPEIGN